ncbi:MAG: AMP-binding protein [Anaerolineae bacterium]|nr:AMP-binding protein [Anaerolineae bacterium]
MIAPKPNSIVEPFLSRAETSPDSLAVILIGEDNSEQAITIGDLASEASHIANNLSAKEVAPETLVLIVLPHSRELVSSIWGCFLAGAVPAIFTYPSPTVSAETYHLRVKTMVEQSKAQIVLTTNTLAASLTKVLEPLNCKAIVVANHPAAALQSSQPRHETRGGLDKTALIQYSSGSTGARKGVMLSHAALLNYAESINQTYMFQPDDIFVNWLPLYHDLGLILSFLHPILKGYPTILISPFHWVIDPGILFMVISKHKGSITWMPNFAFRHCLGVIQDQDLKQIDLSSIRVIGNGGEPADIESMQAFQERYQPFGLRREAMTIGYGLAENTLGISSTFRTGWPKIDWVDQHQLQINMQAVPLPPHAPNAKPIVSCGIPHASVEIKIIDPEKNTLPDRAVGEILTRSSFMFSGYYQQPGLTDEVLQDGWLATGDLGYLADGEIYVCGRIKDLIIYGGHNIYPQDIEAIVNTSPEVRPGRCAAFGIKDNNTGTELIVVVAELKAPLSAAQHGQVVLNLRRQVLSQLDCNLSVVRLLDERDWIIKTPSGKIARSANKEKYLKLFGSAQSTGE